MLASFCLRVVGPNIMWFELPSCPQHWLLFTSSTWDSTFLFFIFMIFFFALFCPIRMSSHHVKHIYYVTMLILAVCCMLLYCNRIHHSLDNYVLCQFIRIIIMGGFVVWCMGIRWRPDWIYSKLETLSFYLMFLSNEEQFCSCHEKEIKIILLCHTKHIIHLFSITTKNCLQRCCY